MAFSINPALVPAITQQIEGKNRSPKSLTFGAAALTAAFGNQTVGGGPAKGLSIVTDVFTVPEECTLLRVGIAALAHSGTPTIQITVGATTSNAVVGLLPTPVTVTSTGYAGQTIPPVAFGYPIAAGSTLALRVQTQANGWVSGLHCTLDLAALDGQPEQPVLHSFGPGDF